MANEQQKPIYFYGAAEEPYGCFSNFSPHGFRLDGKFWPTSEHYFQAQKFTGTPHLGKILHAQSPRDAARMGRSRKRPLRPDWEAVKEDIMRQAVYAKFTQHLDICQTLLDTGDRPLIENSPVDTYWGCGKDGSGKNRLGVLLVELRDLLRQEGFPRASRALFNNPTLPTERVQLPYERTFTPEEYIQLRRGFIPKDMDDHWFIFLEDAWLYLHRSWTGYGIFQVRLEPRNEGHIIAEAWASRDPEQYTSKDIDSDIHTLGLIIDRLLFNRW